MTETNRDLDRITSDVDRPEGGRLTRRQFVRATGLGGLVTAGLYLIGAPAKFVFAAPNNDRQVIAANAKGMVVAQPSRCVGCRRCELACTEFNEGKAAPSMARVTVNRNQQFGPEVAQLAFWRG